LASRNGVHTSRSHRSREIHPVLVGDLDDYSTLVRKVQKTNFASNRVKEKKWGKKEEVMRSILDETPAMASKRVIR